MYQNEALKGVEATYSYTVSQSQRFFIYFKVMQKLAGRHENILGICLEKGKDVVDQDWIDDMISGKSSCLDINYKVKTSPMTMQSCDGDFCVQATMTASHQAYVFVHVLPKNITDFYTDDLVIDQDDLDHLLDIPERSRAMTTSASMALVEFSMILALFKIR